MPVQNEFIQRKVSNKRKIENSPTKPGNHHPPFPARTSSHPSQLFSSRPVIRSPHPKLLTRKSIHSSLNVPSSQAPSPSFGWAVTLSLSTPSLSLYVPSSKEKMATIFPCSFTATIVCSCTQSSVEQLMCMKVPA